MKIEAFELERWQSVWENRVELNIAESGVEPLSVRELLEDNTADLEQILDAPLGYPQTNGSEELRARIAALYGQASANNVLLTCGGAEANYLATWMLIERGDEVVFMQPNYMQVAGLAKAFGAEVTPWWLCEKWNWAPDADELAKLVTTRTKDNCCMQSEQSDRRGAQRASNECDLRGGGQSRRMDSGGRSLSRRGIRRPDHAKFLGAL
jgi:aspartate/methionine/tyrosine aminotransferase